MADRQVLVPNLGHNETADRPLAFPKPPHSNGEPFAYGTAGL